jgi:hypothetical protein
MLPSWSLPAAAVAAVLTYVAWTAAAASDDAGSTSVLTLIAAVLFWLSLMALAAALVQRGVARYRDRDRR